MIQTLKLDPDTRTDEEIKIARAKIEGQIEAVKLVIEKIQDIEHQFKDCGYEISKEFIVLKNALGIMVYKDWNYTNES